MDDHIQTNVSGFKKYKFVNVLGNGAYGIVI